MVTIMYAMLTALSMAGQQPDTKSIARLSVNADTDKKAANAFKTALERLSNTENWSMLCGNVKSAHTHSDEHASQSHQPLKQGDYLCATTRTEEDPNIEQTRIHVEKIETHLNPCADWEAIAITVKHVSGEENTRNTGMPEIFTTILLQREKRTLKIEIYEKADSLSVSSPEQAKTSATGEALSNKWEQLAGLILSQS